MVYDNLCNGGLEVYCSTHVTYTFTGGRDITTKACKSSCSPVFHICNYKN